jgi:hypothetical protein
MEPGDTSVGCDLGQREAERFHERKKCLPGRLAVTEATPDERWFFWSNRHLADTR